MLLTHCFICFLPKRLSRHVQKLTKYHKLIDITVPFMYGAHTDQAGTDKEVACNVSVMATCGL